MDFLKGESWEAALASRCPTALREGPKARTGARCLCRRYPGCAIPRRILSMSLHALTCWSTFTSRFKVIDKGVIVAKAGRSLLQARARLTSILRKRGSSGRTGTGLNCRATYSTIRPASLSQLRRRRPDFFEEGIAQRRGETLRSGGPACDTSGMTFSARRRHQANGGGVPR